MNRMLPPSSGLCIASALLLGVCAVSPASATTYIWPELPLGATPPCNGTLQACINGTVAGDTVLIEGAVQPDLVDRYGSVLINETLTIPHALTLMGDTNVDAVFGTGHSITAATDVTGDQSITLRHLVLQGGSIVLTDNSTAASTFTVEDIRMDEMLAGSDCAINLGGNGTLQLTVNVGNNTLELRQPYTSGFPFGICVLGSSSGVLTTNIYDNRVHAENGALFGGISQNNAMSAGTATIDGNTVTGAGFDRGITVGPIPGAPAASIYVHDNWVAGQTGFHVSTPAALLVQPQNSTVHLTNNTLVYGRSGLMLIANSGTAPSGTIANNLIAFNTVSGIVIPPAFSGIGNHNNLVYANASNTYTPGAGTLTVDPMLNGVRDARLRSGSPAIDAGSNADVPGLSADADAEPRIANGVVDIGAYEFRGQETIVHTADAGNTVFNYSNVALPALDSGALLLATPHHDPAIPVAEATQNVGVFYSAAPGAPWAVYYENPGVAMTPGRRFSVTSIGFGAARFLHTSTLANDVNNFSQLSNATLPNLTGLVLGVTHNYNPGGVSGTYDDERLGFTFQSGHWYLENQNGADDFPSGRYFNVLVEPLLALNAFKATVGAAPAASLVLPHRLLDDNPCAAPQVFRDSTTGVNDTALSVDYQRGSGGAPGHWYVVAEGSSAMFPAAAAFNVIVDGAQANACRDDVIFANGFDG
ncbi:MAG TPA: choice-of-anchor Q domain-containing protein [Rudaea sp.]|nr:choice-of-anchor Q domain-containing protein [Rudaea sp.]